jgi:hypothetical protein
VKRKKNFLLNGKQYENRKLFIKAMREATATVFIANLINNFFALSIASRSNRSRKWQIARWKFSSQPEPKKRIV